MSRFVGVDQGSIPPYNPNTIRVSFFREFQYPNVDENLGVSHGFLGRFMGGMMLGALNKLHPKVWGPVFFSDQELENV